jgi:simple sugar transport system ATP-binding protein
MVELRGITKSFPGVIANEGVDLDVKAGEIHALLGENGAGKSTLMNILTGIYQPDAGDILIEGLRKTFAAPVDALAAGIGMVHQHFKLVRSFTVAENVHLGWDRTPGLTRARDLSARTHELAQSLGLSVRPDAHTAELSTGEQQRVEILRVLSRAAKLLILDEPTAVLTPTEARELFKTLRTFVAQGNAVILISHKLDEVLEISDRVSVLRGGRKVATEQTRDCTSNRLARLMVGQDIVLNSRRARSGSAAPISATPILQLRDVAVTDSAGRQLLDRVSLELRGGEILGIAGVAGNGQKELSQVLTGMRRASAGQILLGDRDFTARGPRDFAAFGVGHIPEDRLHSGLAPELSITDNVVMREYSRPPVSRGAWYRPRQALALARRIGAAAAVRVADFGMPAGNLSGGNQQRLVARREMRIATRVLVAAYPSRGLDVGAIDAMMRYLAELRDAGVGVILISEELDELLNLSDRIAVMCRGSVMGSVDAQAASIEQIGLLMAGQRGAGVPLDPRS